MKINHKLFILFFSLITFSSFSQNERVEDKMIDCLYLAFEDEGLELKNTIKTFQDLLIEEKILKDATGSSYIDVLKEIAKENGLKKMPSKSFRVFSKETKKPSASFISECQISILNDSINNNLKKIKKLENVFSVESASQTIEISSIAKKILSFLNEDDFELTFYKLSVFYIFDFIDPFLGLDSKLPEITSKDEDIDLSEALNVYLKGNDQIYFNDKLISKQEINSLVTKHMEKHKFKSVIILKYQPKTKYELFITVQDAIIKSIDDLREAYALEVFNKKYTELDYEALRIVKLLYPKNIKAQE